MLNHPTCYLSPKCEARAIGHMLYGVFAREPLEKNERIAVWGGEVLTRANFDALPDRLRRLSVQIEEGLFLVALHEGPADYINHSCNPNAGMDGQIVVVAMRPLAAGEQICFDYAMTDGSDYDEFECHCGAPNCRHHVTGRDWRKPELWERYAGYFSPYLARRIEKLKRGETV
ncbi:SET domain-containing protein [Anaerolineae bacterium CFX7]|nr:SET domain-containing protein [Anaerolineae bacterium CFX7]